MQETEELISIPPEISEAVSIIFNPTCTPVKWEAIDKLEAYMSTKPHFYGEVTERGTPGMYSREIIMPADSVFTSRVHKIHHQFIVSQGECVVYNTLDDKTIHYKAGDHAQTLPGTRRVLYVMTETKWTTFHPTDKIKSDFHLLPKSEQEVIFDEVFREIIQEYNNPYTEDFNEGVFI